LRAWARPLLAQLVLASGAHAREPAGPPASGRVVVALPACENPPYDSAELWAALELEIGQRGLELHAAEPEPPQAPDVSLELPRCERSAESLGVKVVATRGGEANERKVWLVDTPYEARARTLALLIAESLPRQAAETAPTARADSAAEATLEPSSTESEPLTRGAPEPSPLERDTTESAPVAHAARRGVHAQLGAAFQGRSSIETLQPFWGLELNLRVPAWHSLEWAAEAGFATHSERTWVGALDARWWSLSGGLDWSWRDALDWSAGPRLSVAHVSASGAPRAGWRDVHQTDQLVSLGARVGLGLPIGGAWRLSLALELQRALRGLVLEAGGERSVSLDGVIAGAALGLRYAP
jgi:hypothetical protein